MQKIQLGTKVRPLGINRVDVAEGFQCRAILLDPNPQVAFIAWDENLKRKVEVDQDMVIKYGLRPMTTYYYLVAKLNTDMNSNIVNNQFTIEYLQLSENVNSEFVDALNEMPNFTSLKLTKIKKVADGRDFSYIKVIPSQVELPEGLIKEIDAIRATEGALDSMWQLIDASTSIKREQYEKLLADPNANINSASQVSKPQIQQGTTPQTKQRPLPQPKQNPVSVQQNSEFNSEELGLGDDFDTFD